MASVAVVGFASVTRNAVYDSTADEVWSLNMLHSSPVMRRHFPLNVHRMFDIHPFWMLQKDWYMPSAGPDKKWPNANHWKWLTEIRHHYPIYLVDEHPEIHNGVRYPLEEVCDTLLWPFKRGENAVRYFTSTACYMLALAIFEGFSRIELYGFEMGSDTEYVYQKAAAEFWLGIAGGRGIEIYTPGNSLLLRADLYGFEGGQLAPMELVKEWQGNYLTTFDGLMSRHATLTGNDWLQLYLTQGALGLCNELLKYDDPISRQVLESHKITHDQNRRKAEAKLNAVNARVVERGRNNGGGDDDLREVGGGLIRDLFVADGAWQVANKLIRRCDLQPAGPELANRFKWHSTEEEAKVE